MGKYFSRGHSLNDKLEYKSEIMYIKKILNDIGTIKCSDIKLEHLWLEFSDDMYSSGFIDPDMSLVMEFADWLEYYE